MRKNSKLCKVLQTQWVWGTGKTSSLMGSWRETQLKWHRNNKPHFAWIPHSSEQGEKDGKEGQMRSPLTKSIIFKKFYQSTPQTPKPGFRPRPRAVSGNTATSCTFLEGLILWAHSWAVCKLYGWMVRSEPKGLLFSLLRNQGPLSWQPCMNQKLGFRADGEGFPTQLRCCVPGQHF